MGGIEHDYSGKENWAKIIKEIQRFTCFRGVVYQYVSASVCLLQCV